MQKRFLLILILVLIISDICFGQGCSQCKLVAEQGSNIDESSFAANINYGILFLMAIPYVIIITVFHKPILKFLRNSFSKG